MVQINNSFSFIGSTLSIPTNGTLKTEAEKKELDKSDKVNVTENEVGEIADEGWEYENTTIVDTRRILYSKRVQPGKRPYMVL